MKRFYLSNSIENHYFILGMLFSVEIYASNSIINPFSISGSTPCSTEVTVNVKVMDRSMPIFDKQFYSVSTPENIELHTPLSISIQAESPLGRKLIYSIANGNDFDEFAVDFNTGK